jgi:hypothetical protein
MSMPVMLQANCMALNMQHGSFPTVTFTHHHQFSITHHPSRSIDPRRHENTVSSPGNLLIDRATSWHISSQWPLIAHHRGGTCKKGIIIPLLRLRQLPTTNYSTRTTMLHTWSYYNCLKRKTQAGKHMLVPWPLLLHHCPDLDLQVRTRRHHQVIVFFIAAQIKGVKGKRKKGVLKLLYSSRSEQS